MTQKREGKKRSDELIDAMLAEYGTSREAILGERGLLAELKQRVVERALAGS